MDCFYSGMKKSLTALAFGTLGLGIAEFVMMGILPDVAKDLHISIPQAGHFISAYALGVCVGAPGMVLVARTRPLKHILLGLDRKSTRLNSSHSRASRMPSSA